MLTLFLGSNAYSIISTDYGHSVIDIFLVLIITHLVFSIGIWVKTVPTMLEFYITSISFSVILIMDLMILMSQRISFNNQILTILTIILSVPVFFLTNFDSKSQNRSKTNMYLSKLKGYKIDWLTVIILFFKLIYALQTSPFYILYTILFFLYGITWKYNLHKINLVV